MIHRIYGLMLVLILLPDLYIWLHYYRTRYLNHPLKRILWWVPCLVMVVYTISLASIRNFAPTDLTWLNTYLFLCGIFVEPKAIFALFSWIGWGVRRIVHTKHNYGHWAGLVLGFLGAVAYIYGLTIGVGRIKVDHVELTFKDLPQEFDGFRIIHISDLHVGTFEGWRSRILKAEIDSIRAQKNVDLVCFTGDMQNMRSKEVKTMMPILKRLPYTYSVLGNHDYAQYVKSEPGVEQRMRTELLSLENKLGKALCNENVKITRGKSSIWLAGEENYGLPPFPSKGDLGKTLRGIPDSAFVILMQHDPSAWRRDILPHSKVQLTLSGHTHGGQMQVFGFRPTMLTTDEDKGLYESGGRYLYVSAGLGGLVPFRINMPNEITVITLHKKQ